MGLDDYHQLVAQHRDRIFTFAFYTLGHREDAEDVTQDVLVRLWQNGKRLDLERVGAWLNRVTRNACYDLARKRKVRRAVHASGDQESLLAQVPSPRPDPEGEAGAADFRRRLTAALRQLPEPYRSAVVLREIQGLSYREIADVLDRPLNTVKVYLHRGRRLLRQALAEVEPYVRAS
ncbi:MAG: RNA polymerase sigma factor [Acidobacteria bacterium]|nr:MAG: RNA polymerase sigma factor [Acidobacteriota bacterium]